MKKRVYAMIMAIGMMLILTACGGKAQKVAEQETAKDTWIESKLGGELIVGNMKYAEPIEWDSTKDENGTGIYYYPYENRERGLIYISCSDIPVQESLNMEELKAAYEQVIVGSVGSSDMVQSAESIVVSGIDAYKARVKLSVKTTGDYDGLEYVIMDNNYIYVFIFGEKGVLSDEMLSFAEILMDTVEITELETSNLRQETEDDNAQLREGIRPEFKEVMDGYEAFFDEYVEFMKKYMNADATTMLGLMSDYAEYMTQYTETMSKLSELEDGEMKTEEALYFMEVYSRITAKLLEVTQ